MRRNRQRIRKIPLKSLISEGFWSEWGDSNARSLEPKSSAIPTSLHPDIHFSAMIPRRAVKIKFFLSVVIYVVKGDFMPLSAIVESPANAGVARLCGVSPHPIPDTATAHPNQAPYQLGHTRMPVGHYTPSVGKLQPENVWILIRYAFCGRAAERRFHCTGRCRSHIREKPQGVCRWRHSQSRNVPTQPVWRVM